jgi:acyl carrier protein
MLDDNVTGKLAEYVQDTYLIEFGKEGIELSTDLFGAGVFDSMAMVNFTLFIEEVFGVRVEPEAIMDGSLVSIQSSAEYINARQA